MTLMYKQQTLIVGLNFTKIINLFLNLIINNNVVQGQQREKREAWHLCSFVFSKIDWFT